MSVGHFIDVQRATCGGSPYVFVHDRENFASWFAHVDEHGQRERFWSRIAPGDVVLDVGSGCGSYTLPALACGAAHVYAFCPKQIGIVDPSIDLLLLSLGENGWRGRCSILPFGLYSQTGWLVAKDFAPPSEFFDAGALDLPPQAMPVTTLDKIDADELHLKRLDWVKIDVEGAEVHVLEGGRETLKRLRPKILVENHLFKDADMEVKVAAVLEPLGYVATGTMPYMSVSHTLWEVG